MGIISKVATTEWKLQVRSPVFWLALIVLLFYSFTGYTSWSVEESGLSLYWIYGRLNALIWQAAVLVFLVPSSLSRVNQVASLIWTIDIKTYQFVAGKFLGMLYVTSTLAITDLILQMAIPLVKGATIKQVVNAAFKLPTTMWLAALLILVTTYFFIVVLVGMRNKTAYMACAALLWVSVFRFHPLDPLALYPHNFVSDMIGYGLEYPIIIARTWLYLSFIPILSIIILVIYTWHIPLLKLTRPEKSAILLGAMIALPMAGWGIWQYHSVIEEVMEPTNMPVVNQATEADYVDAVYVKASLDPQNGLITGEVELAFQPTESDLFLYVPHGLTVTTITDCTNNELPFAQPSSTWLELAATPKMCIAFSGTWVAAQPYDYTNMDGAAQPDVFIGNSYAYILPWARWYPAPLGEYKRSAHYEIVLSFPIEYDFLSTSPTGLIASNAVTTISWDSRTGKPYVGIVIGNYVSVKLSAKDTVWVAPGHEQFAKGVGERHIQLLKALSIYLDIDPNFQLIEVPILPYPLVIEEIVLIPENRFQNRLSGPRFDLGADDVNFQAEVMWLARGWLLGQFDFLDWDSVTDEIEDSLKVLRSDSTPDGLAFYMSLHIVDTHFGTDWLETTTQGRAEALSGQQAAFVRVVATGHSSELFDHLLGLDPSVMREMIQTLREEKRHETVSREDMLRIAGQHSTNAQQTFQAYYERRRPAVP